MYVSQVTIEETKPCTSIPGHMNCNTRTDADLSELLPYLNGDLEDVLYYPQWKTLTIKKDQVEIKLRRNEIDITGLKNMTEAREIIEWIKDLINDTDARRSQITPNYISQASNAYRNSGWRHCWKR